MRTGVCIAALALGATGCFGLFSKPQMAFREAPSPKADSGFALAFEKGNLLKAQMVTFSRVYVIEPNGQSGWFQMGEEPKGLFASFAAIGQSDKDAPNASVCVIAAQPGTYSIGGFDDGDQGKHRLEFKKDKPTFEVKAGHVTMLGYFAYKGIDQEKLEHARQSANDRAQSGSMSAKQAQAVGQLVDHMEVQNAAECQGQDIGEGIAWAQDACAKQKIVGAVRQELASSKTSDDDKKLWQAWLPRLEQEAPPDSTPAAASPPAGTP